MHEKAIYSYRAPLRREAANSNWTPDFPNELWKKIMLYTDARGIVALQDSSEKMKNVADGLNDVELLQINSNVSRYRSFVFRAENDERDLRYLPTSDSERNQVASYATLPEYLTYLALHEKEVEIRATAVRNLCTRAPDLDKVIRGCDEEDGPVRKAAVSNPSAPVDALKYAMTHDNDEEVRAAAEDALRRRGSAALA